MHSIKWYQMVTLLMTRPIQLQVQSSLFVVIFRVQEQKKVKRQQQDGKSGTESLVFSIYTQLYTCSMPVFLEEISTRFVWN